MNVKILTLSTLILMFTSACSGTHHAYYQTLKIAFSTHKDTKLTLFEVQQSDIDLISVKRGERPIAIMALAYLENDQHKWISRDKAMLTMEKGRIVRTLGLTENLLYLSNTDLDPLKSLSNLATAKKQSHQQVWSRISDRVGDEYGYPIESIFSQAKSVTVHTSNLNIDAILYIELVSYNAPANYLRLNRNWENYFWYAKSGELIKSRQIISPLSEPLEITYLSRIARLNQ
jgi:hypothetical protein